MEEDVRGYGVRIGPNAKKAILSAVGVPIAGRILHHYVHRGTVVVVSLPRTARGDGKAGAPVVPSGNSLEDTVGGTTIKVNSSSIRSLGQIVIETRVRYSHMVSVKEPCSDRAWRGVHSASVIVGLHIADGAVLNPSHHNPTSLDSVGIGVTRIVVKGRVRDDDVGDEAASRFAVGANAASSEPADVHIVDRKSIDVKVRTSPESNGNPGMTTIRDVAYDNQVIDDDVHARRRIRAVNGDRISIGGDGGPGIRVQRSNPQRRGA